jgi:DNA (cytosine-5)-methyltransferase 1
MVYQPRVIDLFAGAGGLSLGAARAGFKVAAAVDNDRFAVAAHQINFPNAKHLSLDVSSLSGKQLLSEAGVKRNELAGLVGGPPCQGFSSIGHRVANDSRNSLFQDFFRLVAETNPVFFLAENVPGILAERNRKLVSKALGAVPDRFIMLDPIVVNASKYGAPTKRQRVFFFGFNPNRMGRLKSIDFAPADVLDVRVGDALTAMPALRSSWQTEELSWRIVGELADNDYGRRIANDVPPGVGNKIAMERYRSLRLVSGFLGTLHSKKTIKRFDALGAGEADPVSKGIRLDRNGYCPTLRAGTAADRGSYQAVRPIHPTSPRVIAPREAARLQGFPDWFQFHPTKWHAFRQIGNSVSPIVAEYLLAVVRAALQTKKRT